MSALITSKHSLVLAILAAVLCVSPAAAIPPPGPVTESPLPVNTWPQRLAAGPDGNVWFTEYRGNAVGRVTPAGVVTAFTVPTTNGSPWGIAAGPDGNMWFTELQGSAIGRIAPDGTITEFPLSGTHAPYGIVAGPDGNMWFTDDTKIGRITPAGVLASFDLSNTSQDIAAGPDGNLWFTEPVAGAIGQITPLGVVTEFDLPGTGSRPEEIAAGPDGNIWFTESTGNKIGRITPAGVIAEFAVPTLSSGLLDIAAGPDGNMWFTENAANKVGRITFDGVITEFAMTSDGTILRGIAAGPDGNIWFAAFSLALNKLGRFTPEPAVMERRPSLATSGQVGLPLVCDADIWGPTATVTTAWQRNGVEIAGQTGPSYTPVQADIGAAITCTTSTRLPGVLAALIGTSNPITIIAAPTGPSNPADPGGVTATVAVVWAPGVKTAKAGKTLKVQYGVTSAVALQAQLKGKKTLAKQVNAKAGTNTLTWKLPKSLKAGKYTLRLLYEGTVKASTKVKIAR